MATTTTNENTVTVMAPRQLHGRRQIFTEEKSITSENIRKVLNKALRVHNLNRSEIRYLQRYLRGVQPVLDRVKTANAEINNKTVVNLASQIVTFKTANFAGEPIQYVSRGSNVNVPGLVEQLNSMMLSEGKPSKDMELAKDMFTCGVGYRLILNDKAKDYLAGDLYDEAPFEIYTTEPANSFIVRRNDVTKRVLMGVTYVFLDDAQTKVEYTVYTDDSTYTIIGSAQTVGEIKTVVKHNFGMVPLIEYACNPIRMGAFEVVLPLLDAYSLLTANRIDGVEQFIQALMVFDGVDISRDEFLELKTLGAIKLPKSTDGTSNARRLYYLNEQLDQAQTQTLMDDIYDRLLQIVGMPSQGNANTSDSSNNGAMIIKSGQWDAQARILETQGMWKSSDTESVKVVLRICHDADALNELKVSDIEPKFGIHNYEDRLTKVQAFTTLIGSGCPPIQAFTLSGLSRDPEADAMAYEAYQEQQQSEQEQSLMEEVNRARTAALRSGRSSTSVSIEESGTEEQAS